MFTDQDKETLFDKIDEIKQDVTELKLLVNNDDVGIMKRLEKVESDIGDIKNYIARQKTIILVISVVGSGLFWAGKLLIDLIRHS